MSGRSLVLPLLGSASCGTVELEVVTEPLSSELLLQLSVDDMPGCEGQGASGRLSNDDVRRLVEFLQSEFNLP